MANFTSDPQIPRYSLIRIIIILVMMIVTGPFGIAQNALSSSNKKALKLYQKGQDRAKDRDFAGALDFFEAASRIDPGFYEAFLRRGSLFNAMGMEDSVYANFTRYLKIVPNPNPTILNRMASLAFKRGNYLQSQNYLDQLAALIPAALDDREMDLLKHSLIFAQSEIEKETAIEITPLPPQINKFALQYLPTITIDNSTLIYTKRDFIEGDEDIVVSNFQDGMWTDARSISQRINSPLNEGACTVSADGRVLIYTSCDKRDSFGSCDLYISRRVNGNWTQPKNLGQPVNSQYWESQPSLSADGSKIYFSSNRPGGMGGRDLWVSKYANSIWSKPENLGEAINTWKDETTPFIHPNGETLYFSSNGYPGMGGYDLVRSNISDSVWSTPVNLGHPVNSFNDEVALLIAGDGKTAYFAKEAQRDNRIIESKIVSFVLPGTHRAAPATYIVGRIVDHKSDRPLRAGIQVIDLEKNELLFNSISDSAAGQYTMVLPADKDLACYVKKKGYFFYENNIFTKSNSLLAPDTIEIRLKPIAVDESLVLKNIYFEIDSWRLNEKSLSELANVIEILNENPSIVVQISGHTDNSGSRDYNQILSEKRAEQVYFEIIKKNIDKSRVQFKGFGDQYPVGSNDSENGRQSNRRIEFRVLRLMP